ncbi:Cof-type HAD-IIB family hydrolase [Ascidiimonas sp. W6]|uniref:Cof-type HAD-IIB family hydrolase n=1 Tax=Ascidiimonas meishanensis TaxID=3128903 RepID=UPI0030EC8E61
MQYKIVFTDLDGTLLSQKKDISPFTAEQLSRLQEKIPVILVSARMPKSMTYIQTQINGLHHPLICYNGALVIHNEVEILSKTIAPKLTNQLFETTSLLAINLGLYHYNEWYTEKVTERIDKEIFNTKAKPSVTSTKRIIDSFDSQKKGFHKIMCMGTKSQMDELITVLKKDFTAHFQIYRSNDTIIEISPKDTSKLLGIKALLKNRFQISLSDAMAFGDNYNDIEMIKAVGHGVAVANARNEVVKVADAVAEDYKMDGVAKYVKQMFNL